MEWWHYELDYAGKDWLARAEELGFSKRVLTASATPSRTEDTDIPQGGAGLSETSNYYGPPGDPGNRQNYVERGKDELV